MWNGVIPDKCKQHYKRGEEWQCFFGHKLYSFLSCELMYMGQISFIVLQLISHHDCGFNRGPSHPIIQNAHFLAATNQNKSVLCSSSVCGSVALRWGTTACGEHIRGRTVSFWAAVDLHAESRERAKKLPQRCHVSARLSQTCSVVKWRNSI